MTSDLLVWRGAKPPPGLQNLLGFCVFVAEDRRLGPWYLQQLILFARQQWRGFVPDDADRRRIVQRADYLRRLQDEHSAMAADFLRTHEDRLPSPARNHLSWRLHCHQQGQGWSADAEAAFYQDINNIIKCADHERKIAKLARDFDWERTINIRREPHWRLIIGCCAVGAASLAADAWHYAYLAFAFIAFWVWAEHREGQRRDRERIAEWRERHGG